MIFRVRTLGCPAVWRRVLEMRFSSNKVKSAFGPSVVLLLNHLHQITS